MSLPTVRTLVSAIALMTAGLAGPALAQPADAPSIAQPEEWTLDQRGNLAVITAPEGNLDIAVIAVGEAENALAAARAAWQVYDPDAQRTVELTTPAASENGWDQRVSISYATSPSEQATVNAMALRQGDDWTVLIVNGAQSTANIRSAAVSQARESVQAEGYAPEDFSGQTAHRLTPERIALLRDFVEEAAERLDVPGVGFALIDQGEVVYEGGVGVRSLGQPEPVDADTSFMIASNTKGMSTLLLSILVDQGLLDWDQPVVDLYPSFRLGSDSTTESTLVRHLLCACTGLPRKDWGFILADQDTPASDVFRQLSETEPTSPFGELFQYNNNMAAAAGYVGGALAYPDMEIGAAYDRAMDELIFQPLAMFDTTFDFDTGETGNWAPPHGLNVNGEQTVMTNHFNQAVFPYRPAGGAFSTTSDMAHYVQLELSRGLTPDGERLVSEENLLARRERGVEVADGVWYGMGLFDEEHWGIPVVTHGGTLSGYHSNWYALPESGVGAVILTNADTGAVMLRPFLRRLVEVLYDGHPEAMSQVEAAAARLEAQSQVRRQGLDIPGDPAILDNLATRYESPGTGTITVFEQDGETWVEAGSIRAPLATRANPDGTVSIVSVGPGVIHLEAEVGEEDGARTLTARDSQHVYHYVETE
ncbi:serine hydrolase [uncultured Maricaulis sp.]|uniref:serine hydrolase domain-containing protein n=1 Tax=uncultured Maricaulis sp. TaxID=174710 RepID=UPI002637D7A4|nr:serine hydrolase domain-containing protein [uncultured Maricaulis sp.]